MSKATITVRILDKELQLGCLPDQEATLQQAAELLDQEMQTIRRAGKIIGADRIAIMAALNIAYELLQHRHNKDQYIDSFTSRLQELQDKIDGALTVGSTLLEKTT